MMKRLLIAFLLLCPLTLQAQIKSVQTESVPTDSATVWRPVAGQEKEIRGTVEPIPRQYTSWGKLQRNLGFVPYGLLELTVRPVVAIVRTNELYHITRRLAQVLIWDVDPIDSRIAARFGYESGFGLTVLGVHVSSRDWFGSGLDYDFKTGYLSKRNNLLSFEFSKDVGNRRFEFLSRLEHKDDRPFYGLGANSPHHRFDAHRRLLLQELSAQYSPVGPVAMKLTGYMHQSDLDNPDDGPVVSAQFPNQFARAEYSAYRGLEAGLTVDTRNDGDFSTRGSLAHFVYGYNDATSGGDESYLHYSAEIQRFQKVYRHDRSIVVRGFMEGVIADDDDRLPYTELSNLGGRDCLRGFSRDRFTDTHAILLTTEYRYPVTSKIQGRLFGDWGRVMRGWDKLRLEDLAWSYGLALAIRFHDTPVTAQVAHSREGTQFYLGTALMFSMKSRRLR
jgi:Omp85 superfamily domain